MPGPSTEPLAGALAADQKSDTVEIGPSADISEVVFTLPEDILQLWPFDDDQSFLLDSFWRTE